LEVAMLEAGLARRSFSDGGQAAFAKASAGETKKSLVDDSTRLF